MPRSAWCKLPTSLRTGANAQRPPLVARGAVPRRGSSGEKTSLPPLFDRSHLHRLHAGGPFRLIGAVLLATAVLTPSVFGADDHRSARAPGSWASKTTAPEQSSADCCPDVINFGELIDFNTLPNRVEIDTLYRPQGVLFGHGASGEAQKTMVEFDYGLAIGCRKVLTGQVSQGDFTGWEFFIFVDPLENRWAAVQSVGARIGHSKEPHSCFIAAYDGQGNLLESKFNSQTGYQFLSIERPTADINIVLVGDCQIGGGGNCYPDPAGSALNCLSFSTPISSGTNLPASIAVPQPPIVRHPVDFAGLGSRCSRGPRHCRPLGR